jgi:hypothetical protein
MRQGNLIANAPHMPVHLGSMGESIKTVIRENAGTMQPGDVYVLNDPYHGGTHLPDITVITPVYLAQPRHSRCSTWAAGATMPTSVAPRRAPCRRSPPRIEEEGVQINNVKLVDRGVLREAEMLAVAAKRAIPVSRNPQQNMADLKAQIAANEKGVQELRKMVDQFGLDVVQAYMGHVQDNAEESVRRVITRLKDGQAFTLPLDNGAQIRWRFAWTRPAQRGGRFHRHLAAADQQLQRAHRGVHGGGAVCVPHAGGRRHSAQRGLPQAAQGHHPGGLHAQPQPAGVGGGGQCGNVHLHHQCAVWRAGRDGGQPVHHEQLHLRQRAHQYYETIAAAGAGGWTTRGRWWAASTAPAWCRPT